MKPPGWVWLLGGAGLLYLASRTQPALQLTQTIGDTVTASLSGWQNVQQGPQWVPIINSIESTYGIPPNLLARIAYQESRFRPEVIDGTYPNPKSGALGMMQMMPKWFASVRAPVPFNTSDINAQIDEAAQLLVQLYNHFGDWSLAIAGYNDGQTNIDHVLTGTHSLPQESIDYVSQVLADVPVAANALLA
jgi:soluble lytic murein transglycosylase-like protein